VRQLRTATVTAWRLSEGDISPSGARVVSVQRDPSRGHVRVGFSDASSLDMAGERRVVVLQPCPLDKIFLARAVFLGSAWRRWKRLAHR